MAMMQINANELDAAAKWARQHATTVHVSGEPPIFAIRNLGGSRIGCTTVITCETCDAVRVSNANTFNVTDYDAW